jgi:hypothetical protein
MAFFNNENFLTPCTIPAVEGAQYDPDNGGAANIAMEAYEDQLAIVKAIHAADMAELACKHQYRGMTESYVAEQIQVVQEKSVKEIFETIKDAIKTFFGKIVTFFKKLYEKFIMLTKSNKSFAEKYTKVLNNLDSGVKVTVTGYDYDGIDKITSTIEKGVDAAEAKLKELATGIDSALNDLSNDKTPNENNYTFDSSYIATEILRDCFDADVDEDALKSTSIQTILITSLRYGGSPGSDGMKKTEITYGKEAVIFELEHLAKLDVSKLKKIESKMTKEFNAIIKTIDKAEKTYAKLPADNANKGVCVNIARNYNKGVTSVKSTCLAAVSAYRTVAGEYANQIKRATLDLVSKAKEAKKNANKNNK